MLDLGDQIGAFNLPGAILLAVVLHHALAEFRLSLMRQRYRKARDR